MMRASVPGAEHYREIADRLREAAAPRLAHSVHPNLVLFELGDWTLLMWWLAVSIVVALLLPAAARGDVSTLNVAITVMSPPPTLLPVARDASANWKFAGLLSLGGIPTRSSVCTTVNPIGGGADDTSNIQGAINSCGTCSSYSSTNACVVALGAGTFTLSSGQINVNKSVVVRGAGGGATILNRTNGAQTGVLISPTVPIFVLGSGNGFGAPQSLASDATKGSFGVTLSSAPSGISIGSVVNVDELANGQAEPDCCVGRGQGASVSVWAEPDYRVEWNAHNPAAPAGLDSACYDNNFANCNHTDATAYSIRPGGVNEEYHLVTGVGQSQCANVPGATANTICFDTPLTMTYRTSYSSAVEVSGVMVQFAGIENLTMQSGGDGNIKFQGCLYCWGKNFESVNYFNPGISFDTGAYRDDIENYWAHNAAWPVNGGGGYSIALTHGPTEIYIANGISMLANKVIVMRASGAGTVVAYNYMDDGYINGNSGWVETGINCSHLVGSHHALFEGNRSFNIDSDFTHGASPFCTFFRNHITGIRATFTGLDGVVRNDTTGCCGPLRALASHPYTYWTSFIGNIAGLAGITTTANGWVYSNNGSPGGNAGTPSMLKLGWNDFNTNPQSQQDNVANTIYPSDPRLAGTTGTYATANGCMAQDSGVGGDPCTTIVDGNYDYVTNSVNWATNDTTHTLPASLFLTSKPPYFTGQSSVWPPIDPINATVNNIPAYARWVACQPTPTAACVLGAQP